MPCIKIDATSFVTTRYKKRMEKIYSTAVLFTLIGLVQLVVIRTSKFDLTTSAPIISFMWKVIALICVVLLVVSELFDKFPINWTLGAVTVECSTLYVICYNWNSLEWTSAIYIVVAAALTHFTLNLLGAVLPICWLPGYKFMLVATIVFIICYVLFVIITNLLHTRNFVCLVDMCTLIYLLPLTFYTSSIIHHRRVTVMLTNEYVLSATFIASYFFINIHLLSSIVTYGYRLHKEFNLIEQANLISK